MRNLYRQKLFWPVFCAIVLCFGWLSSCGPAVSVFSLQDWSVRIDPARETLTISHVRLGEVLKSASLTQKSERGITPLSRWSVRKEKDAIVISTREPASTSWTLSASNEVFRISCPAENTVFQGMAPAGEERIPARLENQDNGILYTSLGLVSSRNIHCLFDRQTDTMIRFPEASFLSRNAADEGQMDVAFAVDSGAEISLIPDYYINVLGLKFYKPRPQRYRSAPAGWCSWYCYYMGTTEEDMVTETDALVRYLKPYGLEYVQLDACFTRGEEANYLDWTRESFPRGGQWLFQYIHSQGLKPGLWVNIYGSNYAKAECAPQYPENFYLRDKEGKLSGACCTADDTVVRLDYSNPEVIERHLKPMFRIFKEEWGLSYLKDAGWGTWMDYYDQNRENAFDPTKGSRELYVAAQKALREALGDDVYILGCAMHEVGLCFGIFDGSRIGGDDKAVWYPEKKGGMSMQTYFHSLFGGNYLHNITWHCDPDTVMVRAPLTLDEARTIVSSIALTGQVYMASDFMARLPQRRLDLYRKTIPTVPIVPIDLFPYRIESNKRDGVVWCCPRVKEFPRAINLKVSAASGTYDVVAVFNWDDKEKTETVALAEDLGLDPERDYIVFDFWDQKLKEVARKKVTASIPAHGTDVLVIRPVLERPQLLATSRHITGAVSIQKLDWDENRSTLSGVSEIVPGASYSIFVHVPEGMTASKVEADAEILFHTSEAGVLEVKFSGQPPAEGQNSIRWSIRFESGEEMKFASSRGI